MSSADAQTGWLFCPNKNPYAHLRLFCFPYAGKGASIFRSWSQAMPGWVEVCGVQYPGREQRLREVPFTSMTKLAEAAAIALHPYVDRPYVIFGHSFGALAGFEWVHHLRQLGCPAPANLVVAARRAPHLGERRPAITHLSQRDFITTVQHRYDGIPLEILRSPELLDLLVPTLRADIRLLETYAYVARPALSCPITCLGGLEDPEVKAQDLEGWRHHTTGPFDAHMFPGGHLFLHSAQAALLKHMIPLLAEALKRAVPASNP